MAESQCTSVAEAVPAAQAHTPTAVAEHKIALISFTENSLQADTLTILRSFAGTPNPASTRGRS
ncbi:hypothetical protein [Nocardia thraciensis]